MDEGPSRGSGTRTVLFTDVVGSTARRSRLGDTAADELEREHDQLLQANVARHSGTVVKGTGDGIMAVFESASKGVACAVAIQQELERRSRGGGEAFQVRIGLAAGDVAWERGDFFGIPVNQAARLEAAAEPGQILASDLVRLLAGSRTEVAFRPVGPLSLKGLPEPVGACAIPWEPLAVEAPPLPAGLVGTGGPSFVGRGQACEALAEALTAVERGDRQIVLLAGEPGIGKTRLAGEFAHDAHHAGATVLYGRCDEGLGVPYQPLVEALRHFVDHCPRTELPHRLGRYAVELVRLVPEIRSVAPELGQPLTADPETERYRLFEAVSGWLAASSVEAPLVMVVDDLHWAATPTLLLLRHLAHNPGGMRVLLLGTYRDTEPDASPILAETLVDVRRSGGVIRLDLRGLEVDEVAEVLDQFNSRTDAASVHAGTAGNPFFVGELARHLAETGGVLGIPEGVSDVVRHRLSRLSEGGRHVLTVAAVIGTRFDLSLLEAVSTLSDEDVLPAVEEAVDAGLVEEEGATTFRFSHALVRDVLSDSMTAARRGRLHGRVGAALEELHADDLDGHLPTLALHFGEAGVAGDRAKALDYAARAGIAALTALAFEDAVVLTERALKILEQEPGLDADRVELLLTLAEGRSALGHVLASKDAALQAAAASRRAGSAVGLARSAIAYASWGTSGVPDPTEPALFEEALAVVGDEEPALRAQLLARAARYEAYSGRGFDTAGPLSKEALELARTTGRREAISAALEMRISSIRGAPNVEERLLLAEEMLELAGLPLEESDDHTAPVRRTHAGVLRPQALLEHFSAALELGDRASFESDIRELERLGPDVTWDVRASRAGNRVVLALLEGRFADVERLAGEMLELGRSDPNFSNMYGVHLFWLLRERGQVAELEPVLQATIDATPTITAFRTALALIMAELGRLQEARELLELLVHDDFAELHRRAAWSVSLAFLAEVSARTGDPATSATLLEALHPHRGHLGVLGVVTICVGAVDRFLGMLASTLRRFHEAEQFFQSALALEERIGSAPFVARTRYWYARMLLDRRAPGDADVAMEHLKTALEVALRLQMALLVRELEDLRQTHSSATRVAGDP